MSQVAVCSRSFSKNEALRAELLQRYPNAKFNDQGISFSKAQLIDYLHKCEKVIIGLEKIDTEVLAKLPSLQRVAKYGVGLDGIDKAALKAHNVQLGWKAGVNKRSVSELTLAHMLNCLRHLIPLNNSVKEGHWQIQKGRQLTDKTIGIVGFGHIGQDLSTLLAPFGCKILANDILDKTAEAKKLNVEMVDVETLFSQSDIVTLHIPLDDSTRGLVNSELFNKMKSEAFLINTARGYLADRDALFTALKNKSIAAAAFDVLDIEPPEDSELIALDNFYISPHIGGSSQEAILAMGRAAIDSLDTNEVQL